MEICSKIKVTQPLVDLNGDEMTRIIWNMIKEKLILRFLDIELISYDLSIQNRDLTNDLVTLQAVEAIRKYGVGVKCSTINPDEAKFKELNLKKMWKSPNGTIRTKLKGAVIREPIIIKNIPRYIKSWTKPIVIGIHTGQGRINASEISVNSGEKVKLVLQDAHDNDIFAVDINYFEKSSGVTLCVFDTDQAIDSFADFCFKYALERNYPLYFTTKNTILQSFDNRYKDIFENKYETTYKEKFNKKGIWFEHRLIDNMTAYSVRSEGGYFWACKTYDGDVMSDFVAQGYGSLGLMTSIIISPEGCILTETAHGTVSKHYKIHQEGGITSTNSIASIFAWSRGLYYRSKFDRNSKLGSFAKTLEMSVIQAVEEGYMTKDLAICVYNFNFSEKIKWLNTEEFIDKCVVYLEKNLKFIN